MTLAESGYLLTVPDASDDTVALGGGAFPLLDHRYQLGGLIGRGGVGDVRRAHDLRLGRNVAVKLLHETTPEAAARFAREARTLAGLAHPHLVRVFDAGEQDGRPYLVLELVEGTTLAERLVDGPIEPGITAHIGAAIADALSYVHAQGLVHRDVKPANILLGEANWARLADFGIARLVDDAGMTATGVALGTPAYLAPEQLGGAPVGPSADIYALGLVLIEALRGRRAFEGTPSEVAAARLERAPDLPEDLGEPWRSLLEQTCARDPGRRPTAGEVRARLHAIDTRPDSITTRAVPPDTEPDLGAAPPLLPTQVITTTQSPSRPPLPPTLLGERAGRRRKGAALLVALGTLGVGILLGVFLVPRDAPVRTGTGASTTTPGTASVTARSTTVAKSSTTTTSPPTTSSSTTTAPTTAAPVTTPAPVTPTTLATPSSAANALVGALDSGAQSGQVNAQDAQLLASEAEQLVLYAANAPAPAVAAEYERLLATYDQAVQQGAISPAAVNSIGSDLDALAGALGVPSTTTSLPGAPTPAPGSRGHHGGH